MRVLVTAGPTREHLDAVRFLSNGATGRQGIELAAALARRGHEARLVLGPTHLPAPEAPGVCTVRVVSACEMLAACEREWPECDALVATAAVADHRPAVRHPGKPPKGATGETLALVRNPDIVATLAAGRGRRPVVGFALQVEDAEAEARRKLVAKGLDAIVVDAPAALGAERADFRLIRALGATAEWPGLTKRELAERLVELLVELDARARARP